MNQAGKTGSLNFEEYSEILANISELTTGEVRDILQADMKRREITNFDHYFSDVLIVLQKPMKLLGHHTEKRHKKTGEEFTAVIANLKKSPAGLLFNFEDNVSQVLSGFTIDLRIFFNLLRKMIIIKLNHDRIWTRQFYSEDMKLIYVVMKPLDSVIENRAMVGFSNTREKAILNKLSLASLIFFLLKSLMI